MGWKVELINSGLWLLKAYFLTLILGGVVTVLLAKYTNWGRQFWHLTADFFSFRENKKPFFIVALILLLTLGAVRLSVLFSNWYNQMYSTLQKLDMAGFWVAMLIFAVLATIHVSRVLFTFYIEQAFIIKWREWLNESLLKRWLTNQAYYRSQALSHLADNPDQRIEQDITSFAHSSVGLATGLIDATVSTFAFTLILWNLSGPLSLWGVELPRAMVFLVFIYVLVATLFAIKIGRPLIRLNFLNEKLMANYRYALVRVREYAESIAFYRGEKVEGETLRSGFAKVIQNVWAIIFRSLKLDGFNLMISQVAVIFPFLIQATRFFSEKITLGDLIQTADAFGRLQNNLSFFRNVYGSFADYRATLERLTGFNDTIERAGQMALPTMIDDPTEFALKNITITKPNGALLLQEVNLSLQEGEALLVQGPSGAGKTTLLRAISGIWPFAKGEIISPTHASLFLSQKPYLPLGTLRQALHYPQSDLAIDLKRDEEVLDLIQLGHLKDELDQEENWSQILSLGEQQRLAFGRLLLANPKVAFLDEATSAMDEGLEDAMYRLLRTSLPQTRIISVGHRSTLKRYHERFLTIGGKEGSWSLVNL